MSKKKKQQLLDITTKFSLEVLDNMINLIFSDNDKANKALILKVKRIFDSVRLGDYDDDIECASRVYFIKRVLKGLFEEKIENVDLLYNYVRDSGANYSEEIETIIEYIDREALSSEDIRILDDYITTTIRFSFINTYADSIEDLVMKFKTEDFDNKHDFCEDFGKVIKALNSEFNRIKHDDKDALNDFNTNEEESLTKVVTNTVTNLRSATARLKTGIKQKNKMLGGGYEAGRFYLYVGLQGGWKSGELLNNALDIKHHNKLEVDEEGRQPCVLFVTQENSIKETLQRIWSHYNGDASEIENDEPDEIIKKLDKFGFTKGTAIQFKYRKSKSIDTADVETYIDELEENGYYVVAVIHDYIKRINSTKRFAELYLELGEVCDEFCNIAKDRNIVVISASQFNREAMRAIEEAMKKNKSNPLSELGTSHIGESVKLIDNSDFVISIHKKPDPATGEMMLAYKKLKGRNKAKEDSLDYFVHPFKEGNSMALVPDINLVESKSKTQMGDGLENTDANSIREKSKSGGRFRKEITSLSKKIAEEAEDDEEE